MAVRRRKTATKKKPRVKKSKKTPKQREEVARNFLIGRLGLTTGMSTSKARGLFKGDSSAKINKILKQTGGNFTKASVSDSRLQEVKDTF